MDALLWRSESHPSKGGSEEQLIHTVPQDKHIEDKKLLNTNKDEVIIASTKLHYKRWISWNKKFLEEVRQDSAKNEQYLEALQSLGKEDNKTQSILDQDEGVL
jgi:hypothetical protein